MVLNPVFVPYLYVCIYIPKLHRIILPLDQYPRTVTQKSHICSFSEIRKKIRTLFSPCIPSIVLISFSIHCILFISHKQWFKNYNFILFRRNIPNEVYENITWYRYLHILYVLYRFYLSMLMYFISVKIYFNIYKKKEN